MTRTMATPPSAAELARLAQAVERLLDADLILDQVGADLLEAVTAARRSFGSGDMAASRRHTRRFLQAMEALVNAGRLEEVDARVALAGARGILLSFSGWESGSKSGPGMTVTHPRDV